MGDLAARKLVYLEITLVNTSGENHYEQLVAVNLAESEAEAEAVTVVVEAEIGDAADEGTESSQDEEDE